LLLLVLAACSGAGPAPPALAPAPQDPPGLVAVPAGGTAWSNRSLAALFTLLMFETERGGRRDRLVRLTEPVVVGLEGAGAARYRPFVARYLGYLRRHAGVAARVGQAGRTLHLRFVEDAALAGLLPAAACALVAGDIAWREFAETPGRFGGRTLIDPKHLSAVTIFVPRDAAPWRVRACLIEEIAQALGPVNDLWGLGSSIFNDDSAHVWPTALDLLMLRVLRDPAMETGLPRAEAQHRARDVLDRINPAGRSARPLPPPRLRGGARWRRLTGRVRARGTAPRMRRSLARDALALAAASAPGSAWHCQSLTLLGRVLARPDPAAALAQLTRARDVCAGAHGAGDVRLARLRVEIAAVHLSLDQPGAGVAAIRGQARILAAHGLDERVAAVYVLRSRAFAALGREAEAAVSEARASRWRAWALGHANAGPNGSF